MSDTEAGSMQSLEYRLQNHPVFQHYQALHVAHSKTNRESLKIEENIWPQLTGHTLAGEDKIALRSPSLYVVDDSFLTSFRDIEELVPGENNFSYTFFHLGYKLLGHSQIVHGGFLATILDELACRLAFQNMESKLGVTANLNINYKQPCYVDNFVMVKCLLVRKNGRKCVVKGEVFKVGPESTGAVDIRENLLLECECLVIEPRWVQKLQDMNRAKES